MALELNMVAMYKGDEKYFFVYDDKSQDALINFFRSQAASPESNLNWFDVTVLTQKIQEQADATIAGLERASPQSP